MTKSSMTASTLLAAAAAIAQQAGAQCTPTWEAPFKSGEVNGPVHALRTWDDGAGPAVFAGGEFTHAGGMRCDSLARWRSSGWEPLNGAPTNGMSECRAFEIFDDGSGPTLYAGGTFRPPLFGMILKRTGQGWTVLPGGQPGEVYALCSFDDGSGPALYAGGLFQTIGGMTVNHLAKWNGTAWSAVGTGVAGTPAAGGGPSVRTLCVFDEGAGPRLFVGGAFTQAGGQPHKSLVRWDGSSFSGVGGGISGYHEFVWTLATSGITGKERLYVGGRFATAGATATSNLASWDGATWSAQTLRTGGEVLSITEADDGAGPALFVGGSVAPGTLNPDGIARWKPAGWSLLGSGLAENSSLDDEARCIAPWNTAAGPRVFVAGEFGGFGQYRGTNAGVWGSGGWEPLNEGPDAAVHAAEVLTGPAGAGLYLGGAFANVGSTPAAGLARLVNGSWVATPGVNGSCLALLSWNGAGGPALYVGGQFTTAGGAIARNVARWDGSSFSAMGAGLNNPFVTGTGAVHDFLAYDDGTGEKLYACGNFHPAAAPSSHVARWNGSSWEPVGAGLSNTNQAWVVCPFDLGSGQVLGVGADRNNTPTPWPFSRWDGTDWLAPFPDVPLSIKAMAVYDNGTGPALFAGGSSNRVIIITSAGWQWDNTSYLPTPSAPGVPVEARVMRVANLGDGEALYVGGNFAPSGSIAGPRGIVARKGLAWQPLGSGPAAGTNGAVNALEAVSESGSSVLYVAGDFVEAGGLSAGRIARYVGCYSCYPDCDGDNLLTLADFGCFQTKFGLGDPHADCDGDTLLTLADFGCFQTAFGLGCP